MLQQVGPRYGYFPKPSKFYLVVNEQNLRNDIGIFIKVKILKFHI